MPARLRLCFSKVIQKVLVETLILLCVGKDLFETVKVLLFPSEKESLNSGSQVLYLLR